MADDIMGRRGADRRILAANQPAVLVSSAAAVLANADHDSADHVGTARGDAAGGIDYPASRLQQ